MKTNAKKLVALLLVFAVTFTCLMSFGTPDTYAASKKKFKRPGKVVLTKVSGTESTAIIRFKIMEKNVKGYEIFRKDPGGKWKKVQRISQKKARLYLKRVSLQNKEIVLAIDEGLKSETSYSYKVRAYNKKKINGKVKYKYGKFSKTLTTKTITQEYAKAKIFKGINKYIYGEPSSWTESEDLDKIAQKYAELYCIDQKKNIGRQWFILRPMAKEIYALYEAKGLDTSVHATYKPYVTSFGKATLYDNKWMDDFWQSAIGYEEVGIGYKEGYMVIVITDSYEDEE